MTIAKNQVAEEWYRNLDFAKREDSLQDTEIKTETEARVGEMVLIKDKNGKISSEVHEVNDRWKKYFNGLLTRETPDEKPSKVSPIEEAATTI